jgi:anaerobic selenocysteine-containing dehydrogenase
MPPDDELPDDGFQIPPEDGATRSKPFEEKDTAFRRRDGEPLELVLTEWTFGTETLSSGSDCLQQREPEPAAYMQRRDAERMGFADGDTLRLSTDQGHLELPVVCVENMAPGVLVVPRHHRLHWQILPVGRVLLSRKQIQPVAKEQTSSPMENE